jgi:ribonuclease T1
VSGRIPALALGAALLAALAAEAAPTGALAQAPGAALARSAGRRPVPVVSASELPPEARRTLELITRGGPFPHPRDGVVFSNRERRLPRRPRGYYREYTVPTPGARDRGARRIVAGEAGEAYYSDDHYRTFVRVAP